MKTVLENIPENILLPITVSSFLKKKGIFGGISSFEIKKDVIKPEIKIANT
jgi:hypothetical protein